MISFARTALMRSDRVRRPVYSKKAVGKGRREAIALEIGLEMYLVFY